MIFKDEIAFIFEENLVVDICITQYIFGLEYKNIFYYQYGNPQYKVFKLL